MSAGAHKHLDENLIWGCMQRTKHLSVATFLFTATLEIYRFGWIILQRQQLLLLLLLLLLIARSSQWKLSSTEVTKVVGVRHREWLALVARATNTSPIISVKILSKQKLRSESLPALLAVGNQCLVPSIGSSRIAWGRNQSSNAEASHHLIIILVQGFHKLFFRQQKFDTFAAVVVAAADGRVTRVGSKMLLLLLLL